ncbi:hypothetical protein PENSPDRAFT_672331 [Peniophora sp. CONT]|nr:hypothetical protein PENSPDRAFT_672331 [Peniophora sp. CONT]
MNFTCTRAVKLSQDLKALSSTRFSFHHDAASSWLCIKLTPADKICCAGDSTILFDMLYNSNASKQPFSHTSIALASLSEPENFGSSSRCIEAHDWVEIDVGVVDVCGGALRAGGTTCECRGDARSCSVREENKRNKGRVVAGARAKLRATRQM